MSTAFVSSIRSLRATAAGLAFILVNSAHALSPAPATWPAGDAWAGKALYDTPTGGLAGPSCGNSNCHGPAVNQAKKIANGNNKPAVINNAILKGTMTNAWLRAMTAQQLADVAAFTANPGVTAPAAGPKATLSVASLAFGSTAVGAASAAQTVTLSNTGTAALSLASLASSSVAFKLLAGGTCAAGATLAAGSTCTVVATFNPTAAGAVSGVLTVTHNASPGTSTVALSGTGAAAPTTAPIASLTPTALSFAQVLAGTSSNQTVTLSNTGTAALVLGTVTIAGAQASEFATAAASTCASGASVAPGASCSVLINFTPAAIGARSASLTLAHNAVGSPATVALVGTGTSTPQPVIAVNNNVLSFAAQPLASPSATQTVVVSNAGQAALVLSAVALSGTDAGDFALGGTCVANASVAVGSTCSLTVRFTPTALGARSASVTLSSNTGPVTLSLGGTGIGAPAAAVTLAPMAQAFGLATVGAAPITRSVTLTNSGTAALSLSSVTVSGAGFGGTHNCGASVAAGASCTLTLSFGPASAAALTGLASVTSNAAGSPHTVALSGTGVLASMAVVAWSGAAPSGFADTAVGSISMPATLTLVNQGPGSAVLNSVSLDGAQASEFLTGGSCVVGASLAATTSCTVTAAMAPSQVGPRAATLSVVTNGTTPSAVTLTGNGVISAQQLLAVSATTISFPPAAQGEAVMPMPVTVTNTGTSPVTITALSFASGAFSATPATGALPATLAPAQALDVKVSLNSGAAVPGDVTDTLTVMTDTAGLSRSLEVKASVSASQTPTATNVGGGGFDLRWAALFALAVFTLWRSRRTR